ncbi:uncharacterized protein N0V89_003528 [Didymosphaeria variabile]|uniref:F-box domain-containing protein n=1 Tax=Didymosphaeria variabile TaxID=1932322 RepID=A0A9W9CCT6_9PLEO|nr:uncharacterized protein N0V89_003528 [Didymosphaeria variabile]KAJ4355511.1 hypothetical protein N0V89_003528 [Didymosphaeria variabile]
MCAFEHLPNELLCQVADFLPTGALHALALTSRRLATVSYPFLYKTIRLPMPLERPKQGDNHILLFARTLTTRPDLADGITALDISINVAYIYMALEDSIHMGPMRALSASIVENIPDSLPLGSQRNNKAWLQQLCDADNVAWLGLLLYMLPSLETLYACFLNRAVDLPYHHLNVGALENVFMAPKMDFSLVPGLCGLKELGLQCVEASGEWCYLPKLERMWLDQRVKFMEHHQSHPSLSVNEISMALSTDVLLTQATRRTIRTIAFSGLGRPSPFAGLRRLNIDLDNYDRYLRWLDTEKPIDIITKEASGAASMLSARLKPIAHTLEEFYLTVAHGTDTRFLDHVKPFPVGTLKRFRKLKVLWLPQALIFPRNLIDTQSPELIQHNEPRTIDSTVLPATLQSLRLLYPTAEVHSWQKWILPKRVLLPELKCIETMITSKHGATLLAYRKAADTWNTTTTTGISERAVEYNSAKSGDGDFQTPNEAQLLFEIALRDKLIEELHQKLAEKEA